MGLIDKNISSVSSSENRYVWIYCFYFGCSDNSRAAKKTVLTFKCSHIVCKKDLFPYFSTVYTTTHVCKQTDILFFSLFSLHLDLNRWRQYFGRCTCTKHKRTYRHTSGLFFNKVILSWYSCSFVADVTLSKTVTIKSVVRVSYMKAGIFLVFCGLFFFSFKYISNVLFLLFRLLPMLSVAVQGKEPVRDILYVYRLSPLGSADCAEFLYKMNLSQCLMSWLVHRNRDE